MPTASVPPGFNFFRADAVPAHEFWFTLTNPLSNTLTITSVTVTFAAGYTNDGTDQCDWYDSHWSTCAGSINELTWNTNQFNTGLPPGADSSLEFEDFFVPGTVGMGTFTTQICWSDGSCNAGPSFIMHTYNGAVNEIDMTTSKGPFDVTYTAGTGSFTISAQLSNSGTPVAASGVPIVFYSGLSSTHTGGTFSGAGVTCSGSGGLQNCWILTDSSGKATVTYQPTNTISDQTIYASQGLATWDDDGTPCTASTSSYGHDYFCEEGPYLWNSGDVTTIAGNPTTVAFTLASDMANDYSITRQTTVNTHAAATYTGAYFAGAFSNYGQPNGEPDVQFNLQDRFGNDIFFGDANLGAFSILLTANGNHSLFDATNANVGLPTSAKCDSGANYQDTTGTPADLTADGFTTEPCPATVGAPSPIPFDYYQSGYWGTSGSVAATVTGTYNSVSFSVAGADALVTSTFDTVSNAPVTSPVSVPPVAVTAGHSKTLSVTLTTIQDHVPITFYLCNSGDNAGCLTSTPQGTTNAGFSSFNSGKLSYNATTNALGVATAKFFVPTWAGSITDFVTNDIADFQHYLDGHVGNSSVMSSVNGYLVTDAAAPVKFAVILEYPNSLSSENPGVTYDFTPGGGDEITPPTTGFATPSADMEVDVAISDIYNNEVVNPGGQIQLTLTPTGCTFGTTCPITAPNPYIEAGLADTYSSPFGAITWTMPSTPGTLTLKVAGYFSGCSSPCGGIAVVEVVSAKPNVTLDAAPGPIMSKTNAISLTGDALASNGFGGFVSVTNVDYKVDSGAWNGVGIAPAVHVEWSQALVLANGLHTVWVNASDAMGDVSATQSIQILVDNAPPTIGFTTANNANISLGTTVNAFINDTEGDLNMTAGPGPNSAGVWAKANGTLIPFANVHITGANNLGHAVSYAVAISGLVAGNWVITLDATDLVGNAGVEAQVTVNVIVPFAQSFVVQGTPSTGSLGGYSGINVAYKNLNPTSQSVVVFAVWKNSLGQTAGIGAGSATFASGQTQSLFIVQPVGLSSGTYSVNLFVFTTGNNPVSVTTTISVTV